MIKTIIKLGLIALVALIGYNYFFGNVEERESSAKIIEGVKGVGKSVADAAKSGAEKLSERKLDRIIDDMSLALERVKNAASDKADIIAKAGNLEDIVKLLKEETKTLRLEEGSEGKERRELRKKIQRIEKEIQKLAGEAGIEASN